MTARPASRSQFIPKLHRILSLDQPDLRWISKDSFEITSDTARAIQALSHGWNFRRLSSFVRQLSYYGFKRLSDRRKSQERRSDTASTIVFAHLSGYFLRDDTSRLDLIVRKTRARKHQGSANRKHSRASTSRSLSRSPSPAGGYSHGAPSSSLYHTFAPWDTPGSAFAMPRPKPNLRINLPELSDRSEAPGDFEPWQVPAYPTPTLYAPPWTGQYPQWSNAPATAVQQQQHPHPQQLGYGPAAAEPAEPAHSVVHRGGVVAALPSPSDSRSHGSTSPQTAFEEAKPQLFHGGGGGGDDDHGAGMNQQRLARPWDGGEGFRRPPHVYYDRRASLSAAAAADVEQKRDEYYPHLSFNGHSHSHGHGHGHGQGHRASAMF